jgi:hypothetical protein
MKDFVLPASMKSARIVLIAYPALMFGPRSQQVFDTPV